MSETTTSVPLKTAEGAAHQLLIALRTIAAYPVTNLLMNMDAANMQRIAVRALEAQAAPAAVAIQGAVKLLRNEAARLERLYGRRGWYGFGDEKAAHIEHLRVAEALAATPARPATEDSSAGDLAEVQAEPVAVTTRAELQKLQARGVGSPVGTMFHPAAEGFPVKLYTAPQAQPADALDPETAKNSARYDWLSNYLISDDTSRDDAIIDARSTNELNIVIDAAMAAAQEGGNASVGKDGAA